MFNYYRLIIIYRRNAKMSSYPIDNLEKILRNKNQETQKR
jgi:hypothetical protein